MITVPCKFDGCDLHFESKYELIYHVESDHIPQLKKRRMHYMEEFKEMCDTNDDSDNPNVTQHHNKQERFYALYSQPMPMSLLCKLHPYSTTHKVRPVSAKALTLNFCHYRKKTTSSVIVKPDVINIEISHGSMEAGRHQQTPSKRIQTSSSIGVECALVNSSDVKSAKESRNAPTVAGVINTPISASIHEERRFRCDVEGCKKAYKNQQGLRAHIRNAHSSIVSAAAAAASGSTATPQRLTPAEESILNRQLPGSAHSSSPHYSSSSMAAATTGAATQSQGYSVYSARVPPVDSGTGSANIGLTSTSSNYVVVSVAQQLPQSGDGATTGGLVGNPAVTTVRQVIQSQAAVAEAAAAAGEASSPSNLYLAGGRFPFQRSNLSGKYPCQHCPKTYKTMMNLNKHVQENHPKHSISGISYSSTLPQYALSPMSRRSQSPKSFGGTARTPYGLPLSPASQQQQHSCQPHQQSSDCKAPSPAGCQSGENVALVSATPPPSGALQSQPQHNIYNIHQKMSHQQQQPQPYYMAASPAAQNRQPISGEYYSPIPSSGSSHQPTAIFVTQSSPALGHVSQMGSTPDNQSQQTMKYTSWVEQSSAAGDFSRPSSADAGGGSSQPPPIIVGRSAATSQSGTPVRPTISHQQPGFNNVQLQCQPIAQRSMSSAQSVAVARQSQYYQSSIQQQRHMAPGIITPYSQTSTKTTPVASASNPTTTIRISSLKQYHHAQQQPPQQQTQSGQLQQQQAQYIQIQQQPQQHPQQTAFTVPASTQLSQQQAVSIASQPPPPPQYHQITGSPSYVVRTTAIQHQPGARYVAQHQSQSYSVDGPQPHRIIASSPMAGRGNTSAAAGGATMAQVGGGNTVYYRTGASMASGQPVILRTTATSGGQPAVYPAVQQPSTVRMIPVLSGAASGDCNIQRLSTGQQQIPQSVVYQSQQPYGQQSGSQGSGQSQQQPRNRTRNVYATGRNTVILQQGVQSQSQAHYSYGNGDDSTSGVNSSQNSNISSLLNSSLPYASTAAALAGADPSTPIRAIVSRGLAEHGVNRYNYAGARGSRLDADGEGRVSLHYRSTSTSSSTGANQHDYGKTSASYVSSTDVGSVAPNSQLSSTPSKAHQLTIEGGDQPLNCPASELAGHLGAGQTSTTPCKQKQP